MCTQLAHHVNDASVPGLTAARERERGAKASMSGAKDGGKDRVNEVPVVARCNRDRQWVEARDAAGDAHISFLSSSCNEANLRHRVRQRQ